MTAAAWSGLAREAGRSVLPSTADLLLNPALTAARILAETPEAIPTLPSFRIPEFADLEPLALAVGADPQAHLAAVRGLAAHRADISDAFAAAGIFAAAAAAELAHIVAGLISAAPGVFAAAAPLGPGAQMAAVAALTGKALTDAGAALGNLEEELNRVAQRLAASTAAALAVPLPGGSVAGQMATEALAGLEREYPVAMAHLQRAQDRGRRGEPVRTFGGRLVRTDVSSGALDAEARDGLAAARGRFARNAVIQGSAAELFKAWAATVRVAVRPLPRGGRRPLRRAAQGPHHRRRAGLGRGGHHGLRGHLPVLPG